MSKNKIKERYLQNLELNLNVFILILIQYSIKKNLLILTQPELIFAPNQYRKYIYLTGVNFIDLAE